MKDKEVISGLEAMVERANLASRKIEYNSVVERLTHRVEYLEEKMAIMVELFRKI